MGGRPRAQPLPRLFPTTMADPPWMFRDNGTRMSPAYRGRQRKKRRYRTMPLEDVMALGGLVRMITPPDAILGLWAPHALVLDGQAQKVARAWGYEPQQEVIWKKVDKAGKGRMGGGHYARICTEPMLICTRGRATRLVKRHDMPNHFEAERGEKHSEKPAVAFAFMEQLFEGPYLEMFSRSERPGWVTWGNEVATVL